MRTNTQIHGGQKVSHKLLSISLPNIDRFTIFHWRILWKICNKGG